MADPKPRVPIAPSTKVADLLDSWPELEETLVAQAPAFRRLRNPVLRRTVARVATLEQAAGVGGVAVRDLVSALRRAAGTDEEAPLDPQASPPPDSPAPPDWLDPTRVAAILDADTLLAPGEVLRVDSGFRPVPLVEALEKQGFLSFVRQEVPGRFETYLTPG